MNWTQLLQAALTLVVGFAVRYFFNLIGYPMPDAEFALLVGAIVTYLLGLFGVNAVRYAIRNTRFAGLLGK